MKNRSVDIQGEISSVCGKENLMFEIGEYIIYGSKGVCEVMDITTIQRDGVPDDRLYYLLHPLNVKDSKVFTPVDNDKTIMRPLISLEEAKDLISEIPDIEELQVPSEKLREQTYKDCIRTGDCREYLRMIKTLHHRKRVRIANGKKITSTDERYLKQAEEALHSELAVLFEVPREEIPKVIEERLGESDRKIG